MLPSLLSLVDFHAIYMVLQTKLKLMALFKSMSERKKKKKRILLFSKILTSYKSIPEQFNTSSINAISLPSPTLADFCDLKGGSLSRTY